MREEKSKKEKLMLNCIDGMIKEKFSNEKGMTMVELLVSIFIFSLVVVVLTGILVTNLRVQQRIYTTQRYLGEINYAMEYVSRLARMGKRDTGDCIGYEDYTYKEIDGRLTFLDYRGRCVEFFEEDNRLKMKAEGEGGVEGYLTSPGIIIENFHIEPVIDPVEDALKEEKDINNVQPSVMIFFTVKEETGEWFDLDMQTTVTKRGLDVAKISEQ